MSRIGKKPIEIPKGVAVSISGGKISVVGPNGTLERVVPPNVKLTIETEQVVVERAGKDRTFGAYHGLARSLIANMVTGVTGGFEKKMAIEGVGYKVSLQEKKLVFNLGYANPREFPLPAGISAEVGEKGLFFSLKGADKELVGQTAATIRGFRAPEPYKGKGIRYVDEQIRRKAGKTGAK